MAATAATAVQWEPQREPKMADLQEDRARAFYKLGHAVK